MKVDILLFSTWKGKNSGQSYVESFELGSDLFESYIDHVEDVSRFKIVFSATANDFGSQTSRTDEEKLRNAEEKYRAIKREASLQFELSEFKWKEALKRDPTITLDHWIEKYGYDYLDACEERAWAKTNLKRAQQTGSQDVLRQKDLMESALNSQKLLPG